MDLSLDRVREWNKAISTALNLLHTADFPAALMNAINTLIYAESMIVCLEKKGEPPILLADVGVPLEKKNLLLNRYFSIIYMIDPFCLAVKNGLQEGFYHITDIAPDGFFESEYYNTYYIKSGTKEDCYFIFDLDYETKISICIYHNKHLHSYSQQEIELTRAAHSLVKELALLAWQASNSNSALSKNHEKNLLSEQIESSFLEFGNSILTDRERDVTHLILRGHSSKSAARELDISPGTVQEHRKNIYRKLEISSQSELFSLFIDYISHSGELN